MPKITKKQLIEESLAKYSPKQIEEAIYCTASVIKSDWSKLESRFWLTSSGLKTKADKIRTENRGFLKNTSDTDTSTSKRLQGDTSSENIQSIKISLKFK